MLRSGKIFNPNLVICNPVFVYKNKISMDHHPQLQITFPSSRLSNGLSKTNQTFDRIYGHF